MRLLLVLIMLVTSLPSYEDFADAFLFIQDKRGRKRPLIRNSVQRRYYAIKKKMTKLGFKRYLILKYRRGGITTEEQAQSFYQTLHKGQSAYTLAHRQEDTQKIFGICKYFYNNLDERLRPQRTRSIKKELRYEALGSDFTIGTARATGSARGNTLQKVHGSEVAFWQGDASGIQNLIASLTQACSHGEVTFETTANGHNHYYEMWKDAKTNPESPWVAIFLPWFKDDQNRIVVAESEQAQILETLNEEEKFLVARHKLDIEQIKWRRRLQAELPRLFAQEYPENDEQAFLLTGNTYFDKMIVAQGIRNAIEPHECPGGSVELGGLLKIWYPPEEGVSYIIGTDAASGAEGKDTDESVSVVIEAVSGRHCATLAGQIKPHQFAVFTRDLARRYNDALWAIEREQHGHAVLNTAENVLDYQNLYRHVEYNKVGREPKTMMKKVGWPTNVQTRPIMLDTLDKATKLSTFHSPDAKFWAQAKVFVADVHGKYKAANGEHDDYIFALGVAWSVRNYMPRTPGVAVT